MGEFLFECTKLLLGASDAAGAGDSLQMPRGVHRPMRSEKTERTLQCMRRGREPFRILLRESSPERREFLGRIGEKVFHQRSAQLLVAACGAIQMSGQIGRRLAAIRAGRRNRRGLRGPASEYRQHYEQLRHADELGQKGVHSGVETAALVQFRRIARHADDDRALPKGDTLPANRVRGLYAVHDRHLVVHENDFESVLVESVQSFTAVADTDGRVSAVAQQINQELAAFRAVFRDKNSHLWPFASPNGRPKAARSLTGLSGDR